MSYRPDGYSNSGEFLNGVQLGSGDHEKKMADSLCGSGALPTEEATLEQLSALYKRMVLGGQVPYTDFSVFTPFGKKATKAARYKSFVMQQDGSYLARELPGPASVEQWLGSYKVMRSAFIMLELVQLSTLLAYETHFLKMVQQYAPDSSSESKFRI